MEKRFELALAEIDHCNKCGFCLPACPTYRLTGNEVDSPRGRIALVEGALRNEIESGPGLEASLTYCLGCRACETACPSGVEYHRILDAGKSLLDKTRPRHRGMTFLPRTLLRLTKRPRSLARVARWGRRAADWPVPERLKELTPMLSYQPEKIMAAAKPRKQLGEAVFFKSCVQEALYSDANDAAVQLLTAVGYQVAEPARQTCCGALAWHAGRQREARALARRNIRAFEKSGDVPVVNAAGGCGAMLSEYGEIFADDREWAKRAERFSARVQDWTRLLDQLPDKVRFLGAGERVALQNSCHLVNVEGGGDLAPQILTAVENDTFVAAAGQDRCCGSAGIYNIQHPDWSARLLDEKMDELSRESIDRLVVVNPGCQLQMTMGVHRAAMDSEVEHLARYLYRAFLRGQREAEGLNQVK